MHELYVSRDGRDSWSGTLREPNAQGTDGPLATIDGARKAIRRLRTSGSLQTTPIVRIRGGRYPITHPICFTPDDSHPAIYCAADGEQPIIDGGVDVTGWTVGNANGHNAWIADVGDLLDRFGPFRSLFVNGQRAPRTRLPAEGWFHIESAVGLSDSPHLFEGANQFVAAPGDLREYRNMTDAELLVQHFWVMERMPIAGYDPETRRVASARRSVFHLGPVFGGDMPRYCVENTFEGLTEPGQWYLDRTERKLYYLPRPEDSLSQTRIVAPVVSQFIRLEGDPQSGAFIDGLAFRGLTFEHADWVQPTGWCKRFDPYRHPSQWHPRDSFDHFVRNDGADPLLEYASAPQAAHDVPGAIHLYGARRCVIEQCVVRNVGFYAVELGDGCSDNRVVGNVMEGLGAGGVNIDGANLGSDPRRFTHRNQVTDNHITHGGHVFPAAVGVLVCHAYNNRIAHNHIADLYYSGISVGWCWTWDQHISRGNIVELNHIHDLGQGLLADMGGIYILGPQPGTIVRGNVIHDVRHAEYGGWGIYTDETTSHILIEHNLVYRTASEGINNNFHNVENIYRHNIVAFPGKAAVAVARDADKYPPDGGPNRAMNFLHNILLTDGQPMFSVILHMDRQAPVQQELFVSDANLFWDISNTPLAAAGEAWQPQVLTMAQWQALGSDCHTVVADPQFVGAKSGDFRLADDSPSLAVGFRPFDHAQAGPRPPEAWQSQLPE